MHWLSCSVLYSIFRYKKSNSSRSKALRSSKFYPAEANHFGTVTVVNQGYVYAERGSNSLPYDYPYIEANGAQALSITTFQPQRSRRSTNRNSTSTCGYIEIPAQVNDSSSPHPTGHVVPNSPSNISEQPSILSSSSSSNSTNHKYVNANRMPTSPNDTRVLLSPPADGARVNIMANVNSDSGYVTLHS